jgi:Tfp pilus assembly protein PilF
MAGGSPAQAQTVFRAGAPAAKPSPLAWLAERPLVAFSTAAGLFAIGYGIYLYLQISSPGMFVAQRPSTPPPPVPPAATTPPPPAPASAQQPIDTATTPLPPLSVPVTAPPVPSTPPSPTAPVLPPAAGSPPPAAAQTASGPAPLPAAPGQATPPAVPAAPLTAAPPAAAAPPVRPAIAVTASTPETPPAARPKPPARAAATRPGSAPPAEGVAAAAGPQVIPVDATLASAYQALEKGQLNDAERLYRQALNTDPRSMDAMLGLGATLTQQNKGDAASQVYLRALEQEPRNPYAQAGLLAIGGRSDPAAAETRLKQLITREPSAFLYFTLGNLYAEQGQWAGAQSAYFQAHNLAPDNPDYAYNLAIGLEHLSQPKIALNYYRRAVSLAQTRGNAQFEVARVQARIKSLETAVAEKP